jgi:hypothetical protein
MAAAVQEHVLGGRLGPVQDALHIQVQLVDRSEEPVELISLGGISTKPACKLPLISPSACSEVYALIRRTSAAG